MNVYKSILEELKNGKKAVLLTALREVGQGVSEKSVWTEEDLSGAKSAPVSRVELLRRALQTGEMEIASEPGQMLVAEPFFPEPSLVILGAGHIAQPLCELGSRLGFAVTVVDDRPAFANRERFPQADRVICESFEKCFDLLAFHPYTFVVIVTRGHRYDMLCLREIAQKAWAYAGMIGSKRRVAGVLEQLIREGVPRDVLNRVNTPIGLDIGAVTPEEISVSILAQVISYRRLANPKLGKQSGRIAAMELDRDVLKELSAGDGGKKAVATILSSKGSAPRKAGAKMLVWPDGRILGSIGGGCAESEVIVTARDLICTGGYRIQTVDLTGSVAEDEGMVCGGVLDVLVETVGQ